MLIEIVEVNETKTINLILKNGKYYEVPSFEIRNPLADEYDDYIDNHLEEYLDSLYTYYHEC